MNPVDGLNEYELRNLAGHLAAAGRARELRDLLTLEWAEVEEVMRQRRGVRGWLDRLRGPPIVRRTRYQNAWQDAKERHGLTDSYAADLALARSAAAEAAQRELARAATAPSLGFEVRYAVMATSINELAGRVPAGLAAALVTKRVWTPIQAASYARRIIDVKERAKMLVSLVPVLVGTLRDELAR
jgi:hypothetical protein